MARYEYDCPVCGESDTAFRAMAERDSPYTCSMCGSLAKRREVSSSPAALIRAGSSSNSRASESDAASARRTSTITLPDSIFKNTREAAIHLKDAGHLYLNNVRFEGTKQDIVLDNATARLRNVVTDH